MVPDDGPVNEVANELALAADGGQDAGWVDANIDRFISLNRATPVHTEGAAKGKIPPQHPAGGGSKKKRSRASQEQGDETFNAIDNLDDEEIRN